MKPDLDKLVQRRNETTVEYLKRMRSQNSNPLHEIIHRIKEGSGETIEGADELRKSMDATFKDYPDAFVEEVIKRSKKKLKENDGNI